MCASSMSIPSFTPHCEECPLRLTGVADPTGASDATGGWLRCECAYHAVCSQCGWPITDAREHPDHHNQCAACAREQLTAGRPPEDRHELPALLAALGLSPDVPVTLHLLLGTELDDDWGDYRIEWALIPDVVWRYAATDLIVRHPWRVQRPGWEAPQLIVRWRQWRIDAPGYLERTMRRQGGQWLHHWQVRAVGQPLPTDRLREFMQLLQGYKGPGRDPDDLTVWWEEELRPEIVATIADGLDPDQKTLADRLGLTLSGLQKKFLRLNRQRRDEGRTALKWKRLVADIQAAMRR
jgi:hypothetical protein